jgi:hypothetical protein
MGFKLLLHHLLSQLLHRTVMGKPGASAISYLSIAVQTLDVVARRPAPSESSLDLSCLFRYL